MTSSWSSNPGEVVGNDFLKSVSQAKSCSDHSSRLVGGDVIVRIFADVGFDKLSSLVEQLLAVGAEMSKMQSLSELQITFGKRIDRFQSGLVIDAAEVEVDDDVIRILGGGEEIAEFLSRAEEQDTMKLIDLASILIGTDIRHDMLALLPDEDHRRQCNADDHGRGEIMHEYGVGRDDDHDEDFGSWNSPPGLECRPFECSDDDHEHDTYQRGHRNGLDVWREKENEEKQCARCRDA